MALRVRTLTSEELITIEKLAHARTVPAREVERARIIWYAHGGERVPAIARRLGLCQPVVRTLLKRFNQRGLDGLQDQLRIGRPAIYSAAQVAEVIAAALTKPDSLGLPFSAWTLDRLHAYLKEHKGIPMKRSRIDELLRREGLRWRHEETWFGERVDPDFAQKRGSSKRSTRPHQPQVSSSV
jgi:transposase